MRAPVTLLLALSLLVSSVPLHAFAEDVPAEPVVDAPIGIEEPAPTIEVPKALEEPTPVVLPLEEPLPVVVPIEEPIIPVAPLVAEPQMQMLAAEPLDATLSYFDISATIELPNGCTITDDDGTTHVFPIATTTEYLAVCALMEAVDEGTVTELSVTNSEYGLFITSINDVPAGTNEYWSMWINGGYGNCGINCQALVEGDEIVFVRTSSVPDENNPGAYIETQMDRLELTVDSLVDEYDNVLIPDTCTVADVSGATHTFPATGDLLGVCALKAAQDEGYISGYTLTDASFGLFISSLDGISAGTNEYWSIWINDGYGNCGVGCQKLVTGDEIAFVRTSSVPDENNPGSYVETQFERVGFRIIGATHVETEVDDEDPDTGGNGDDEDETDTFDVSSAFSYLVSLQEEDGSIENDLVTDWAAVAFSVSGAPSNAKSLLKQYLKNEEVDVETPSDYIRHAMAMLALNLNPYSAGPEDYITPIVESFDGTQLGEGNYINDDIFSLIVLTHAGYSEEDELIQDVAAFVISEQEANGSWFGVDMTAAAVQALAPLSSLPGVPAAIEKAESYLRSNQASDGGFGGAFATPWAIQAIESLGDSPTSWKVGDNTPLTYLASIQNEDGSVTTASGTESDAAWATAYAITAAKGQTWHELLDDVRRQEPTDDEEDNGSGNADTDDETEGEVLGATDEITPEPLAPSFTYEAPAERSAPKVAQAAPSPLPEEAPSEDEVSDEAPTEQTQTASAADAAGGSWLARMIGSLWSGLINFLANLFS